MSSSSF